jgi:hypothetical protein
MLLCACTAARRATHAGRARELGRQVDWDELTRLLVRQRLLPLGARRLRELLGEEPPPRLAAPAGEALSAARRLGVHQEMATLRVAAGLEGEGVPVLGLKGPLLATALYDDPGMRVSQDMDLLVAADELDRAVRVLEGLGFARARRELPRGVRPPLHVELVHPGLPDVELHWRVHWFEEGFSAEMLARARPENGGPRRARPEHEFAALLLFWARDGFAGLRFAADVARWWDRYGEQLPPGALASIAARYPGLRPALTTAAWHAERVVGVPAEAQIDLPRERWRRRAPAAARLSDWRLGADDDQIRANITLVDTLLAPPHERRTAIGRHVLRSDRSPAEHSRRARGVHAARVVGRYGLAAWGIRGGREWSPLPAWAGPGDLPRRGA